jgi:hypothetical protein
MSATAAFNWTAELEKTVVHSLVTSFGLDFLLFKDQKGGDVDTVHNARQGVYATQQERQRYDERGAYDSKAYHTDGSYIARGRQDKAEQAAGQLQDRYRGTTMDANERRDLDHTIAAKEIHEDAGRVLAGLQGEDLANRDSNLASTGHSINRSKKDKTVSVFVSGLPDNIAAKEKELTKLQERLSTLPQDTPEQRHRYRELRSKIEGKQATVQQLKQVDAEKMLEADQQARKAYDQEVNHAYYTSSKFLGRSATAAAQSGLRMGTRQMLGLVMAEVWFELRERLPQMLEKSRASFQLGEFLKDVKHTLHNIWQRLVARFRDFLIAFKDGVFGGVLSSVTTTLFNIVMTTEKGVVKIIREIWGQLVKALKLIAFNPDNLSTVELAKAVTGVVSLGVATVIGSVVYAQLAPLLNFPFGADLAAFAAALTTGLVTLGLQYFLLHSAAMRKVWDYLERSSHLRTLQQFQAINATLDTYLEELARMEFGLDADELEQFSLELQACNDELARNVLLRQTLEQRQIETPFEMGNTASTRQWLAKLAKS